MTDTTTSDTAAASSSGERVFHRPSAFESQGATEMAQALAREAHYDLSGSAPNGAELALVDHWRAVESVYCDALEVDSADVTGLTTTCRRIADEALFCLMIAALKPRGHEPGQIAPADFPALVDALLYRGA